MKYTDSGEQQGETAAVILQTMLDAVKDHEQELSSMDVVADIAARQVGKVLPMDEKSSNMFQPLA